jgi:hypothetical protein
MKKFLLAALVITLILTLGACKSPADLIGEKVGESIVEGITGSDVDVEGDSVTIKGEDGEVVLGGKEWPDNEIMKKIPKFTKGTIDSTMVSDETGGMINLTDVAQADYDAYVEEVKSAGFNVDAKTLEMDQVDSYYALNSENYAISLTYAADSSTFSILLEKQE